MPTEGKLASTLRARNLAHPDVPTCRLTDTVARVRKLMQRAKHDLCIIVNDRRVVLGRVYKRDLPSDDGIAAEQVMESGPSTFRPDVSIDEMVDYMSRRNLDSALITTSDGVLVGVLYREEAENALRRLRGETVLSH